VSESFLIKKAGTGGGATSLVYASGGNFSPIKTAPISFNVFDSDFGKGEGWAEVNNTFYLRFGGVTNANTSILDTSCSYYSLSFSRFSGPITGTSIIAPTATSHFNYAVYAGGFQYANYNSSFKSSSVQIFNSGITRLSASGIGDPKSETVAGFTGTHTLFAGGTNTATCGVTRYVTSVSALNQGLTSSFPSSLAYTGTTSLGVINFPHAVIYAGGLNYSARTTGAQVYYQNLTRSTITAVTYTSTYGINQGAFINNRGLLWTPYDGATGRTVNIVEIYNNSMSKLTSTFFPTPNDISYTGYRINNVIQVFGASTVPVNRQYSFKIDENLTITPGLLPNFIRFTRFNKFGDYMIRFQGTTGNSSQTLTTEVLNTGSFYWLQPPNIYGQTINYSYAFNELGTGTTNSTSILFQNTTFTGNLKFPANINIS